MCVCVRGRDPTRPPPWRGRRSTQWSTTLSSEVDVPHAIGLRAVRGANLVALRSKFRANEIRVCHRAELLCCRFRVGGSMLPAVWRTEVSNPQPSTLNLKR
jgi:hypothetical protein